MKKLILIILIGNIFIFANKIEDEITKSFLKIGDEALLKGDYAHAIANYQTACIYGKNAKACLKAGICYIQGIGVKSNKEIAKQFYKMACDLGDKEGCDAYLALSKIWKIKLFSNYYNSRIDKIIKVKDGFLISGAVNTNGFIIKIDKNGKILWKKIIDTNTEGSFFDKYYVININKKIYFLNLPSGGNQYTIFALLDENGNIIKKENLNFIPTTYKVYKNKIFIGGFLYSSQKKKNIPILEKFDINKGKIWEKLYENLEDSWIDSILVDNDFIYLIDDKNLRKLNFDGEVLYKKANIFKDDDKLAIKINNKYFFIAYEYTNKIGKVSFDGKHRFFTSKFNEFSIETVEKWQYDKTHSFIVLGGNKENKSFLVFLNSDLFTENSKFLEEGEITALNFDDKNLIIGLNKNNHSVLLKIKY